MHVLHVIDALNVGGSERMLVELANRTKRDGHRVSVCLTRDGRALASRLVDGIALIVLGRTRRFELRAMARLARFVRRERVDVIHCHGRYSFSLLAVMKAARALTAPIVLQDHLNIELDPSVPRWFPFAARYVGAYVGVYDALADWAAKAGVARERIRVIVNAIDLGAVRAAARAARVDLPAVPTGVWRAVAIGGLRRDKAIDVLLAAIAIVATPIHVFVIGADSEPAYAEACRARCVELGLAGRVTFLGQREDAIALAARADFAIHASRAESGPLVLLEYAAIGLPFVATRVGGVAQQLAARGAGRFVAPDDPSALGRAIDELAACDVGARAAEGAVLGERVRATLDLDVVISRWYAIYDELQR